MTWPSLRDYEGQFTQSAVGGDGKPGCDIREELGRGGMGVVYQRLVAVKMILHVGHASTAELARFRTEAEAVARLQHPNIVQIYEVGEIDGCPFFTLEYCAGGLSSLT